MSRPGRPANAIPTVEWKCMIPVNIAAQVDSILLDPVTGRPRYGARSELVTQLLNHWLSTLRQSKGGDSHGQEEGQG